MAPEAWHEHLGEYESWLRVSCRPGTAKMRLYHLRRFAREVAISPAEIRLDDLTGHLARHPAWKVGTRRSVRSSLRSFFSWAHDTERLPADPSTRMRSIPVPAGRPRPATDADVQEARARADERVRLMVDLASGAGLRCCEVAAVHAGDVSEVVRLDDAGREQTAYSLRVRGKGGKVRRVPLERLTARRLLEHDGYVFPGQIEGHLSAGYVSKLISRAMPNATAHQLRHRYASRAYNRGGRNIRAVQELLGHASVSTTQIYTLVEDDDLWRAASAAA